MTTLTEFMIIAGTDNRLYDSWKSRMELYIENRENKRMILNLLQNGPLVWPTVVEEDGTTRTKKYEELSVVDKLQADCDLKATNIVLQGLPPDVYDIFPQMDLGLAVPVFNQGDDPIACLNKATAFLTAVASSSYANTGYKGNATILGGNNARGQAKVVKCYNCQGEGHMSRQCTQPKRPRNAAWFKEKAMLAKVQEAEQILDEEQLAFLADPCILEGQAAQTIILNTAAFQTEDLDTYDFDCDNVTNAKAVLMANLSNCGSDVILEVPHIEPYHTDMDNQSVHAMQGFEQTPVADFKDNVITSDSNIIPYSQYLQETQQAAVQDTDFYGQKDSMILSMIEQIYTERVKTFEQRLNIDLSTREKIINSQMDDMIKEKLALKQKFIEQNLLNQIKEKESLLQTFTVFINESKEKEMQMLTKPKVFYDDTHKQAPGYQNLFYLKKAQRIKPTLYDGSVISSQHAASPMIDDEETLILEETDQYALSPVKIKAPRELAKVSLVNTSLKKLKYHLGQFDTMVKKRITPDAITEGE
ncbi:retrovirus-related pol polyprotein from transposon TNT 1-94 [Tanacetum coccineum]